MTAGEDYTSVESLWFKDENGEFIKNPVRPLFADLDRIPIPDFDLFDYDNLESSKVHTAIVVVSRGCLYNCTYCGNGNFRKVYPNKKIYARFRSPENAILYLKTLLKLHPHIKFINFRDAIFNMFPDWFDKFIELYKQEIHLPCTGNIRFDILTEDTVRRMKEAGFYTIDMGLESGDQEIRFKYLKRFFNCLLCGQIFPVFLYHRGKLLILPHKCGILCHVGDNLRILYLLFYFFVSYFYVPKPIKHLSLQPFKSAARRAALNLSFLSAPASYSAVIIL